MATTQRAIKVEKEERITALLLDVVSAVEVLALLIDEDDQVARNRLLIILGQVLRLRDQAIQRRKQL